MRGGGGKWGGRRRKRNEKGEEITKKEEEEKEEGGRQSMKINLKIYGNFIESTGFSLSLSFFIGPYMVYCICLVC